MFNFVGMIKSFIQLQNNIKMFMQPNICLII